MFFKPKPKIGVATAVLFMACISSCRAQNSAADSCRDFVKSFYYGYTHHGLGWGYTDETRAHPAYFSPALRNGLMREAKSDSDGTVQGIDFDPFLNAQDTAGEYEVKQVRTDQDLCEALVVAPTFEGGPSVPFLTARLQRSGKSWQFTDFSYPPDASTPTQNLSDLLKQSGKKER